MIAWIALAGVITGATPQTPDDPTARAFRVQAAAVVDSGGRPAIRLSAPGRPDRILRLNEVFLDGWRLHEITRESATLQRGNVRLIVQLPPGVPVTAQALQPSEVRR